MNEPLCISRILLPVEFSERCRGAARYAEALACRFHAELVLLHVVAPPYCVYGGAGEVSAYCSLTDMLAERMAQGQAQLDAFAGEAPADLPIRRELLEGDPARNIVDFAHFERFDLIVMPTHGYGPFRRFLIGSVTAKVLHDVDCPVWTGPHLEGAPEWKEVRFRKIACAVDLGPHSRTVLEWAGAMTRACGAELAIVHAVGEMATPDGSVRESVLGLADELGLSAAVHVEMGETPAAVTRAAGQLGADLLVIGRSVHPGVLGRLRANAYAIIRESPCPVVSI